MGAAAEGLPDVTQRPLASGARTKFPIFRSSYSVPHDITRWFQDSQENFFSFL